MDIQETLACLNVTYLHNLIIMRNIYSKISHNRLVSKYIFVYEIEETVADIISRP